MLWGRVHEALMLRCSLLDVRVSVGLKVKEVTG